ncbi:MAG: hypothetical protein H7Y88_07390 [Phycisphaerales bacterium]|nr:hypothetical protein [Phycisphaerales bacterium]
MQTLLIILGLMLAVAIVGGVLALGWLRRIVARIPLGVAAPAPSFAGAASQSRSPNVPVVEEGFLQTLRRVPLPLVVALDVLDLTLDVLAAPIVWILLDRVGLSALRRVAAIEALIPFTGPIPTMTLCWAFARLTDPARAGSPRHPAPAYAAARIPGRVIS